MEEVGGVQANSHVQVTFLSKSLFVPVSRQQHHQENSWADELSLYVKKCTVTHFLHLYNIIFYGQLILIVDVNLILNGLAG